MQTDKPKPEDKENKNFPAVPVKKQEFPYITKIFTPKSLEDIKVSWPANPSILGGRNIDPLLNFDNRPVVVPPNLVFPLDLRTEEQKVEALVNSILEKKSGRKDVKSDKTMKKELLAEILPEVIQHIETRNKEAESAIGQEDAAFLSQKFANDEYLDWKCKQCGGFIIRLDSIPVVADYLKKFSEGTLERCGRYGHLNWFKINKGIINWGIETEIGDKFLWRKD